MALSTGYDMSDQFKFSDGLGKLYIGLATAWSSLLFSGIIFVILNRDLPFLRIRNVPLVVSAVATLHVYWVLCMLAYGLNGLFPCATEFWIMNIYLPLGMALFHASNTRLLHVAVMQRRYASTDSITSEKDVLTSPIQKKRRSVEKIRLVFGNRRTASLIAIGLTIQFLCALAIFLVSRKFHSGFGVVGEGVPDTPDSRRACRRGWEWIFSIIWQIFWSWIYAPFLLWKVRKIRDIHGWRLQTIICCLAGFPASPMWLIALYVPQMSIVGRYFIPPLWFAPSILLIEAFMIFLPCWHIIQHQRSRKETLNIIAEWEKHNIGSSIVSDSSSNERQSRASRKQSFLSNTSSRRAHCHMYTMAALEKALQTNSTPLLLFAALKDFSGENISFLNHVRDWKKSWAQPRASILRLGTKEPVDNARLRDKQYVKAVGIYAAFISPHHSKFPINISHSHFKELEAIFESSAAAIGSQTDNRSNTVTPFDDYSNGMDDLELGYSNDGLSLVTSAMGAKGTNDSRHDTGSKNAAIIDVYQIRDLMDKLPPIWTIPDQFEAEIFDKAVQSVKYMVLTNTWPKFVDAGYAASMDKTTAMDKLHERLGSCGTRRSRGSSF